MRRRDIDTSRPGYVEGPREPSARSRSLRAPLSGAFAGLLCGLLVAGTLFLNPSDVDATPAMSVPSFIASDCSRPVDADLNQWLESVPDGTRVDFAENGCYGLGGSVWLVDRHDITFDGHGSTFRFVTTDRDQEWFRSNLRVRGGSRFTLRDATIVGACQQPSQCNRHVPIHAADGYGQHGLNVESVAGVAIDDVHFRDTLSDNLELQAMLDPTTVGWHGEPTTDVVVTNSTFERQGRMLIGITAADRVRIQHNTFRDSPYVAVDIEPDVPGFVARNIEILDNTFTDIKAHDLSVGGINSWPDVGNIRFEGNHHTNRSADCAEGTVFLNGPDEGRFRRNIRIARNRARVIGYYVKALRVQDLTVADNVTEFADVGCGQKGGVELYDSDGVTISGNDLGRYQQPPRSWAPASVPVHQERSTNVAYTDASTSPATAEPPASSPDPTTSPSPTANCTAPAALRVTAAGADYVDLTWDAVTGVERYEVMASTSTGSGYFPYFTTAESSGRASALSTGVWYFVVRAQCGTSVSAASAETSAQIRP